MTPSQISHMPAEHRNKGGIEAVVLESTQDGGGIPKEIHRSIVKRHANATSDIQGLMQLMFHLACAAASG